MASPLVGFALLAAALGAGTAQAAPAPRFPPRDTCAALPGAPAFRTALKAAVSRRDARGLAALAAPDVKLDFGGGSGSANLRRRLSGPQGPALWRSLARILALGCARQGDGLILPSFFAEDLGNHDPFSVLLVTGSSVRLRAAPAPSGRVVASLSWNLVEATTPADRARSWRKVKVLPAGPVGYVSADLLRSPVDYRLLAARRGKTWKIAAFVAGD